MSTIIDYINKQTITNVIEKAIPEDKLLRFHNIIDKMILYFDLDDYFDGIFCYVVWVHYYFFITLYTIF